MSGSEPAAPFCTCRLDHPLGITKLKEAVEAIHAFLGPAQMRREVGLQPAQDPGDLVSAICSKIGHNQGCDGPAFDSESLPVMGFFYRQKSTLHSIHFMHVHDTHADTCPKVQKIVLQHML